MPLPVTALTHPTTRRAIVSAILQAAADARPGASGVATAYRADSWPFMAVRAHYRPASAIWPIGVSLTFSQGGRSCTGTVLAALGDDLAHWVSTLADSLASPSTCKHW